MEIGKSRRWRCYIATSIVILCGILLQTGQSCEHLYSSRTGTEGNFSSPGYPNNYPLHASCRYVFQGTANERVRISFMDFDLEPGTDAGCLFDYIDIFTIDLDLMKNLEDRLCGVQLPRPFVSIHQTLEVVFKSDYAGARKGFFGRYEFLDERWQPFPPSTEGCGSDFMTGFGGVIVSPGYPNPYPSGSECTWTIRVQADQQVLLKFLELDLGQNGYALICRRYGPACHGWHALVTWTVDARALKRWSNVILRTHQSLSSCYLSTVHCGSAYVAIYNGFASPTRNPAQKLCIVRENELKEFKSKTFRVILRFRSGQNEHSSKGFRIAWTAIWVPKDGEADQCRGGFHCKGGEYCIDTSSRLCNPLRRFCVARSLRCDAVPNCVGNDLSDEEGCFTAVLLVTTVSVAASLLLATIATAAFLLWRRKSRLRKAAKVIEQRHLQQQQPRQQKQQPKTDSSFVSGLDHSPSLIRHGSLSSYLSRRPYLACNEYNVGPSHREHRRDESPYRGPPVRPRVVRIYRQPSDLGGRWGPAGGVDQVTAMDKGVKVLPPCRSVTDFRRAWELERFLTTVAPPGEETVAPPRESMTRRSTDNIIGRSKSPGLARYNRQSLGGYNSTVGSARNASSTSSVV